MISCKRSIGAMLAILGLAAGSATLANPTLPVGTWVNITPPVPLTDAAYSYGFIDVKFAPQNRSTLYAVCDQRGLWKSVNGGESWTRVGIETAAEGDSPQQIQVDPNDQNHLYMMNGVRGPNMGFFVSTDAGLTWTMPPNFLTTARSSTVNTIDGYSCAVEPGNFDHALVTFHSGWAGTDNCGVLETTDGGDNWRIVMPPAGAHGIGYCVVFLKSTNPAHPQGDGNTWCLGTQGSGLWKTTDAGATWIQTLNQDITHGAFDLNYGANGDVYTGLNAYPTLGMNLARSTDNGSTWSAIGDNTPIGPFSYYHSIISDGERLYAKPGIGGCGSVISAPESNPTNWTSMNQTFNAPANTGCGPTHQVFDEENCIIYSACWGAGVWALKTREPTSIARTSAKVASHVQSRTAVRFESNACRIVGMTGKLYDVKGRNITIKR